VTLILAFDTSASGFSVALLANKKILSKTVISESGKQSELLIPEIEKILFQNKIWYQNLDLIAATNGPGSFTGTRIGLSVARTLKLSTSLPLILVNSCEAIAYKYREKMEKIFVLLDAKAGDFFYAEYEKQIPKQELVLGSIPRLARLEDLHQIFPKEKFFLCGSGKKIAAEILEKENYDFEMSNEEDEIEADLIALLALEKFTKNNKGSKNLEPIYLRAPRITERKK
jgi:tRNA threonylcarbamoyladenosine biosynthesis protein TsaB